ncbi:MAG TPA: MucR family transcriptional regulator [Rhodopila sp.]|jgi:predicted transcriptional regulator
MSYQNRNILSLSAQIVAAHAGHNHVEVTALPSMIRNVFNTLSALDPPAFAAVADNGQTYESNAHDGHDHNGNSTSHARNGYVHPTYGQTVFGDHLICMEDGLSMKMLKRHLLTVHGMTPDEYRAKWRLPENYPMVAADYAKLRSSLALQSGLGLKPEDRSSKGRKKRKS